MCTGTRNFILIALCLSLNAQTAITEDLVYGRSMVARLVGRTDSTETWKPPFAVVNRFLEILPPVILSDIDTCCEEQDTYDRVRFEKISSEPVSEVWAAYATAGRASILAVVSTRGDSAILEASIDSLGPVIPPVIRSRSGSNFGFDGIVISVAGNFGGIELVAWDRGSLHPLTPTLYDFGTRHSQLTGGLQFEDVDADGIDEFVSNLTHINNKPGGQRTWSQEKVIYKYEAKSHSLVEVSREWIHK